MSRRSVPRISSTDLREHADQERVDRVWQRLEASLPATAEAHAPRRLNWVGFAAAATFLAFGGGIFVGKGCSHASSPQISRVQSESETDVLAAGDDARSFPLPGGGQLTLKPGSIVEVQRAGGGVTLKLVQGDATLETAAGGGAVSTVMVGDARLDAQASSTMTMSKRADNVDVGVSRGGAVVDSPSLKKNLESGENVSVPLHRQVTAANESPTPETRRRRTRHAEVAVPEGSVTIATPAVAGDWQKAYAADDLKTAATLLRQSGTFDSAVRSANTAKELYEIRDLALQEKEPATADRALRRIADDFPTDRLALAASHELCAKLPPAEGQKYCEQDKNSPLGDPEAAACRALRQANKDEAPKLAQEYVKSHADGGTCRDEAERILHPGADESGEGSARGDGSLRVGDAGAPKGDGKPPASKP